MTKKKKKSPRKTFYTINVTYNLDTTIDLFFLFKGEVQIYSDNVVAQVFTPTCACVQNDPVPLKLTLTH